MSKRTSCIAHPTKQKFLYIREWQIEAAGSHCGAMLLSLFEGYHNDRIEAAEKAGQENAIAEAAGEPACQRVSFWHCHSDKQIQTDLLGYYSSKSIRKSMEALIEKGYIEVGKNPNKKLWSDQSKWVKFNEDKVNEWLETYEKVPNASGEKADCESAKRPAQSAKRPTDQTVVEAISRSDQLKQPAAPLAAASPVEPAKQGATETNLSSSEPSGFGSDPLRRAAGGGGEFFPSDLVGEDVPVAPTKSLLPVEAQKWNLVCGNISKVACCSTSRTKALVARRRDFFWVENFDAALVKIAASDFCKGTNDRGWRADFDWLVKQPDVVAKVMEGKYDNRNGSRPNGSARPPKPSQSFNAQTGEYKDWSGQRDESIHAPVWNFETDKWDEQVFPAQPVAK